MLILKFLWKWKGPRIIKTKRIKMEDTDCQIIRHYKVTSVKKHDVGTKLHK